MSKHLAKIISICAIAVLLPFAVIAIAVTATQAKGVTLSVAQTGVESSFGGVSSEVAVYINNQKQEDTTVAVRKNSKVTVVYSGEGYYFSGWYVGNVEEIGDKAISSEKSYTLSVSENMTLTAVRDVQKYSITYTGQNANGSEVNNVSEILEFNADLPVLANSSSKMFAGWAMVDEEGKIISETFFKATFKAEIQNQEIKLVAVWKENAIYTVFYSINDQSLANSCQLTYNIATGFDAYSKTRDGYKFAGLSVEGKNVVYSYDENERDYIYNGEKLSQVLAENSTAKIYASWECIYPALNFKYEARTNYAGQSFGQLLYTEEGEAVRDTSFNTVEIADKNNLDLDDNFYDYFLGGYSSFVTKDGKACIFNGAIRIALAGTITSYDIYFLDDDLENVEKDKMTFRNVLENLSNLMETDGLNLAQLKELKLEVHFMFDIA